MKLFMAKYALILTTTVPYVALLNGIKLVKLLVYLHKTLEFIKN